MISKTVRYFLGWNKMNFMGFRGDWDFGKIGLVFRVFNFLGDSLQIGISSYGTVQITNLGA